MTSSASCLSLCCILVAVIDAMLPVAAVSVPVSQSKDDFMSTSRHRTGRSADDEFQYAVVIDAGSSGSRVRVYRWRYDGDVSTTMTDVHSLKPTLRIRTGISEVASNQTAARNHIERLIQNASGHVPASSHHVTPIYFMATAGVRQLLENKMNDLVLYVYSLLNDSTINPFHTVSPMNARTLSGEEEGVFEWITVNYLLGYFADESVPTAGIIEMGGASTQIAFVPPGNILADKFPVRIGQVVYALYVHSYLNYGQNAVVRRIRDRLERHHPGVSPSRLDNPCMMQGDTQQQDGKTFVGTADPAACMRLLDWLVYKVEPSLCHPKPCAIGSFYQPSLPPDMDFYAVGSFVHTLNAVGAIDSRGRYLPRVGFEKALEYCQKPYREALQNVPESQRDYVTNHCLLSLYFAVLLNTGYGFANDSDRIYVQTKIAGETPDWTLGAVIYENLNHQCSMAVTATEQLHFFIVVFTFAILILSNARMSLYLSS